MRLYDHKDRRGLSLTALCLVMCVLSGCAMVGPRSISMGRADYNEAINRTEDEQHHLVYRETEEHVIGCEVSRILVLYR